MSSESSLASSSSGDIHRLPDGRTSGIRTGTEPCTERGLGTRDPLRAGHPAAGARHRTEPDRRCHDIPIPCAGERPRPRPRPTTAEGQVRRAQSALLAGARRGRSGAPCSSCTWYGGRPTWASVSWSRRCRRCSRWASASASRPRSWARSWSSGTAPRVLRITRGQLLGALLIGSLLLGIGNGGVMLGERDVPSGLAALIVGVIPLVVLVIRRLSGEVIDRTQIIGVTAGLLGLVVLVAPLGLSGDRGPAGHPVAARIDRRLGLRQRHVTRGPAARRTRS